MLQSMGTPTARDHDLLEADNTSRRFLKLPGLYNTTPNSASCRTHITNSYQYQQPQMFGEEIPDFPSFLPPPADGGAIQDWAALDRLVASHLNGPSDGAKQQLISNDNMDSRMSFVADDEEQMQRSSSRRRYGVAGPHDYPNEGDLWGFAPASNDQICDVSPVHPI